MKLSDILNKATNTYKQYANIAGSPTERAVGGLANMLQTSINKSSPGFKATATTQSGIPVASDMRQAESIPQPEPIRDGANNPIATPVDWYSEFASRAKGGDTSAQDWLQNNVLPDEQSSPTQDFSSGNNEIDFSTPTSQVAYSMEKLNELYGTKSPEDLWALRQKLRFQQSQAAAGDLPASEYMNYQGLPGLQGEKGYTYDQQMGINKSTADIFGTQVSDLDKFMEDYSKGQKSTSGTSSGYGTNPIISTLLASGKFTKEQSSAIKYAIDNGENPTAVILNNAKNIMGNTLGTKTGQLESAYTQMQGIDELLKEFYKNGGNSSFFKGNYEKVLNKLGSVSDPKLVNLASQISSILMTYRNATTGTAASVSEDAKINSIFPGIDKGEMLNNALTKARLSSVKREIDGNYRSALGSDYDTLLKQQELNTPAETFQYNGHTYKKNSDGSASLVSFNNVGSGTNKASKVVAGYDISSYATDPNHERSVATIYQRTPDFKSPTDIDMVIRKVAPKSRITGNMIATAANTYGVDPKMVYAMMLQDSSLGTAGMGARNNNPGNIGQYDNLNRPVAGYNTLQGGVNAVAKWLSKNKVNQTKQNYA
jgi:hypothetical protein